MLLPCDRLTRGLARRGIIALVDDATGYQDDKMRQEIDRIIKAYVAPTLVPWVQKFPHEFFRQAYRLLGWEYKPNQTKHSPYMGKFINKYVFEALPPGVLGELKARLPKNEHGNRRAKLWQLLTVDTGIPHLDRQLTADLTPWRFQRLGRNLTNTGTSYLASSAVCRSRCRKNLKPSGFS
jgi:hypothetical protein